MRTLILVLFAAAVGCSTDPTATDLAPQHAPDLATEVAERSRSELHLDNENVLSLVPHGWVAWDQQIPHRWMIMDALQGYGTSTASTISADIRPFFTISTRFVIRDDLMDALKKIPEVERAVCMGRYTVQVTLGDLFETKEALPALSEALDTAAGE